MAYYNPIILSVPIAWPSVMTAPDAQVRHADRIAYVDAAYIEGLAWTKKVHSS
jgi:hypothetical protein